MVVEVDHVGLMAGARWLGHSAWIEQRTNELLGSWVRTSPDGAVKSLLSRHCQHHAFHARVWRDRMPVVRGLDPDELTTAPDDPAVTLLELLDAPDLIEADDDLDLSVARLVGHYRVFVPQLLERYVRHKLRLSEVCDASLMRWMGLVLVDIESDLDEGLTLLGGHLGDPEAAERARRLQRRLAGRSRES